MLRFVAFVTAVGTFGSLLDSVLGAVLQETVTDVRSGKVVEAPGGGRVLVLPGHTMGHFQEEEKQKSRKVITGLGVLDNNGVNFSMALAAATGGVVVGGVLGVL